LVQRYKQCKASPSKHDRGYQVHKKQVLVQTRAMCLSKTRIQSCKVKITRGLNAATNTRAVALCSRYRLLTTDHKSEGRGRNSVSQICGGFKHHTPILIRRSQSRHGCFTRQFYNLMVDAPSGANSLLPSMLHNLMQRLLLLACDKANSYDSRWWRSASGTPQN
jgi:hypothetical protein